MVSQEQAKKFVEKLTELIDENDEVNKALASKAYADRMVAAQKSLERRINNGEFPTIKALRKKFGMPTAN